MTQTWTIATRGSQLAMWQARHVAKLIESKGTTAKLEVITTTGDKVQDRFLHEIGGKGVFVKELEEALLSGLADLAVHSLKDMPVRIPPAFKIGAILPRHVAHDVLIMKRRSADAAGLGQLDGAWISGNELANSGPMIIGTSSLRRAGSLACHAPKIKTAQLRGNVDTRLRKLADGAFDGIILAGASLERLGQDLWQNLDRSDFVVISMSLQDFTPCAGQGALAIETINGQTGGDQDDENRDALLAKILANLNCEETSFCVQIERYVLQALGGDCTMPFGAYCQFETNSDGTRRLVMAAKIFDRNGNKAEANLTTPWSQKLTPEACGAKLLNAIADDGAAAILTALELPVPESMRLH